MVLSRLSSLGMYTSTYLPYISLACCHFIKLDSHYVSSLLCYSWALICSNIAVSYRARCSFSDIRCWASLTLRVALSCILFKLVNIYFHIYFSSSSTCSICNFSSRCASCSLLYNTCTSSYRTILLYANAALSWSNRGSNCAIRCCTWPLVSCAALMHRRVTSRSSITSSLCILTSNMRALFSSSRSFPKSIYACSCRSAYAGLARSTAASLAIFAFRIRCSIASNADVVLCNYWSAY